MVSFLATWVPDLELKHLLIIYPGSYISELSTNGDLMLVLVKIVLSNVVDDAWLAYSGIPN